MRNNINETTRKYGVVIAAIISALIVMIAGLATGIYGAVTQRREMSPPNSETAQHLLIDAAYSLKNSMSALRLCNEEDTADSVNRTALVHAVRAETALECTDGDWIDSRNKEAFLNDIATVLHSYSPLDTVKLSDKLYEFAARFYQSVADGSAFVYDGELVENDDDGDHADNVSDDDISAANEFVTTALECSRVEYVGAYDGHIEFYTERNGNTGYAVVCDDKIIEYAFTRDGDGTIVDTDTAERSALAAAAACGYKDLTVKWSGVTGKSVSVIMCKKFGDALAGDDCATAVVFGGEVVSFSAGNCECEHTDIPTPKKSETQARRAVPGNNVGEGVLVVRKVNGKERVCYEYRIELDDGVHFVYVCAENGKQMEVK